METVVGGDGRSASIAAASILAKVTRDDYMLEMAEKYNVKEAIAYIKMAEKCPEGILHHRPGGWKDRPDVQYDLFRGQGSGSDGG